MTLKFRLNDVVRTVLFVLVSLVVLGGTNDTILAANQVYVIFAFLIFLAGRKIKERSLSLKVLKGYKNAFLLCLLASIWMLIGLLYSLDTVFSLRLCAYFGIYIFIIFFPLKGAEYDSLFHCMKVCSIILAISIILSAIFGYSFVNLFSFWFKNYDRLIKDIYYGQYSGLIGDRAFASMAMCTAMYLQISEVLSKHKTNLNDVILIGIFFVALMLTGKRISLLMIVCGVVVCLFVSGDKKAKRTIAKFTMVMALVGTIALVSIPQTQVLFDRIVAGLGDTTYNDRLKFWIVAYEMFLDRPITGYGIGSFLIYNLRYGTGIKQYAHNMYFQFAAELGIVGTALIVTLFAYFLHKSIKQISTSNSYVLSSEIKYSYSKRYNYFSVLTQVGFLVYGLTGYPFYNLQQGVLYAICVSFSLYYDSMNIKEYMKNI